MTLRAIALLLTLANFAGRSRAFSHFCASKKNATAFQSRSGVRKTRQNSRVFHMRSLETAFFLHFCPIALAFPYFIRYSPLGSSFFAILGVDENNFAARPGFSGRKKSIGG